MLTDTLKEIVIFTNTPIPLTEEERAAFLAIRSDKTLRDSIGYEIDHRQLYPGQPLADVNSSLINRGFVLPQSLINKVHSGMQRLMHMIWADDLGKRIAAFNALPADQQVQYIQSRMRDKTHLKKVFGDEWDEARLNFGTRKFKRVLKLVERKPALYLTLIMVRSLMQDRLDECAQALDEDAHFSDARKRRTGGCLLNLQGNTGNTTRMALLEIMPYWARAKDGKLSNHDLLDGFRAAHRNFFLGPPETGAVTFHCPAHGLLNRELFTGCPADLPFFRLFTALNTLCDTMESHLSPASPIIQGAQLAAKKRKSAAQPAHARAA